MKGKGMPGCESLGATEMLAQVGWRSLAEKAAVMSGDCKILRMSGESWVGERPTKEKAITVIEEKEERYVGKRNPTGPIKGMFVSSLRGFN